MTAGFSGNTVICYWTIVDHVCSSVPYHGLSLRLVGVRWGGGVTVGKMQMQGVKFAVSVEQCKYCEGGAGPNFSQGELQFCKAPPPVI